MVIALYEEPPPHDTKAQKPIKKLKSETEFETAEEEKEEKRRKRRNCELGSVS